jgi:hypothetical protein
LNYNVLKLANGEDILCNVVETQQGQLKIEAPLLMETISKVTQKGVVESLALGRWIQPYSDEDFFYIEKNSVVIMTPASAGLSRYYEHIIKNTAKLGLKENGPSEEELQSIEDEMDEQEALVDKEDLTDILENFEVDNKTFH